jgi:hypothetical protein
MSPVERPNLYDPSKTRGVRGTRNVLSVDFFASFHIPLSLPENWQATGRVNA